MTAPQSPPTPTPTPPEFPRAAAQHAAERLARLARHPLSRACLVAAQVVADAVEAGVEPLVVGIGTNGGVGVHMSDESLAPALAAAVGLTTRTTWPSAVDRTRTRERFSAVVDGVTVWTDHTILTSALAADEPVQVPA